MQENQPLQELLSVIWTLFDQVVQGRQLELNLDRLQLATPPPPTHDIYVITELFMLLFLSGADLSEAVDVYSDWIDACEQANA